MIFIVEANQVNMYGNGRKLNKDRFELMKGFNACYNDSDTVKKEFADFDLIEFVDIEEPIKHMVGQESLKCKFVICRKK